MARPVTLFTGQWADLPLEVFALVGCNTGEEFGANVSAGNVRLTPDELAWPESGGDRPSSR